MNFNSDNDIEIVNYLQPLLQRRIVMEVNEKTVVSGVLDNINIVGFGINFHFKRGSKTFKHTVPIPYDLSYNEKENLFVFDYSNKTLTQNNEKMVAVLEKCAMEYNNNSLYDNFLYVYPYSDPPAKE